MFKASRFAACGLIMGLHALPEVHHVGIRGGSHRHTINDKALNHRLFHQQQKRRDKLVGLKLAKPRNGTLRKEKKWSHYEGVTVEALETARNHSTRFQPTSCEQLIRGGFQLRSEVPKPVNTDQQIFDRKPAAETGLTFLHIPKNAGASIELVTHTRNPSTFRTDHSAVAWASLRLGSLDQKGRLKGNTVPVNVSVEANSVHGAFNDSCVCSFWHIPPRYLEKGPASNNAYGPGKEVYCVARDPLARALSEFKMKAGPDRVNSKAAAQEFLVDLVGRLRTKKLCRNDCHFLPQTEYVWNERGQRTCHHVLPFGEKLEATFNTLMDARSLPYRLMNRRYAVTHHQPSSLGEHDERELTPSGAVSTPQLQQGAGGAGGRPWRGNSTQDKPTSPLVGQGGGTRDNGGGGSLGVDPEIARLVRCAYALDLCMFNVNPATGEFRTHAEGALIDTGCREEE